jgi:hypothetical protein
MKRIKLPNGGELLEYKNGSRFWFLNNQFHREDGPAMEFASGTNHWCLNGKLHRENGPAKEFTDGSGEWWINGQQIPCKTQKEFEQLMRLKAFW